MLCCYAAKTQASGQTIICYYFLYLLWLKSRCNEYIGVASRTQLQGAVASYALVGSRRQRQWDVLRQLTIFNIGQSKQLQMAAAFAVAL